MLPGVRGCFRGAFTGRLKKLRGVSGGFMRFRVVT